MEIGEQPVDDAEPVAGRDEQRRVATPRLQPSRGVRRGLQRPQAGRADGDDAPAARARALDGIDGRGRDLVGLRMHPVLGQVLGLHRLEGARADVQRHERLLDAAICERLEQRRIEMQAGGRCRDRAPDARVHGLVALGVFGDRRVGDVGRQRQLAVALEPGVQVADAFEPEAEETAIARLDGRARIRGQEDDAADAGRMARPHLHDRRVRPGDALDQHLDFPAAGLAPADARVDDARVVEHQQVVGGQQRRQVGEAQVVELRSVDVQQPARAAFARRHLRNQLGRQDVVEIRKRVLESHRCLEEWTLRFGPIGSLRRADSRRCAAVSRERMVPREGLEPSRCCQRRILSPLRLPFRHPGKVRALAGVPGRTAMRTRIIPENSDLRERHRVQDRRGRRVLDLVVVGAVARGSHARTSPSFLVAMPGCGGGRSRSRNRSHRAHRADDARARAHPTGPDRVSRKSRRLRKHARSR